MSVPKPIKKEPPKEVVVFESKKRAKKESDLATLASKKSIKVRP